MKNFFFFVFLLYLLCNFKKYFMMIYFDNFLEYSVVIYGIRRRKCNAWCVNFGNINHLCKSVFNRHFGTNRYLSRDEH